MLKFFLSLLLFALPLSGKVIPGIEYLFLTNAKEALRGKNIALLTNHTGVTSTLKPSYRLIQEHEGDLHLHLVAIFAPEHGFFGSQKAGKEVLDTTHGGKIPVYSLHGKYRRPTPDMLEGIDLILVDLQDIGSRSYTYATTVFYVMEEAAKAKIPVIVADRPNPINGLVVDGLMLDPKWRSFVGYINVPYCHGMTIGELAVFFNHEYKVKCPLTVVPAKGWKRGMTFADTGLPWIPTSPNIPEATTTYFYPMTGILGEVGLLNIGVGYTLPFKIVGGPWLDGEKLAESLTQQKLPGILFHPFRFTPLTGKYSNEECQGILLIVQDHTKFLPVTTEYTILGILKSLYPKEMSEALAKKSNLEFFHKINGSDRPYKLLESNPYPAWPLRELDSKERKLFLKTRKRYLHPEYSSS